MPRTHLPEPQHQRPHYDLMIGARVEVKNHGRIGAVTHAKLEALGYDVAALEQRLLEMK